MLAGLAVVLASAASVWLAFAPFYRGEQLTADGTGPVSTSATLIAVNGYWVTSLLLVTVMLTAVGFWAVRTAGRGTANRIIILWVSTALLFLFCIAGLWSIGAFYLPAAGALGAAAATLGQLDLRRR
jgi:hypothetical protein